jgi:hypothetical protein
MAAVHHALALAKRGLSVFPCLPRKKEPATSRGFKDATRDGALIRSWWACNPDFNIAVATGRPSGVFAVDVDDAEAELARLEAEHNTLPPSVEVVTAKGRHIYFRLPAQIEVRSSTNKLAHHIDIRGDGGYALLPPSIHPSGRAYAWNVDSTDRFADPPEWLLNLVVANEVKGAAPPGEWRAIASAGATEGHRNHSLTRLAGHLLRHGIDPLVTRELLLSWSTTHCHPPLLEKEVVRTVDSICTRELARRTSR